MEKREDKCQDSCKTTGMDGGWQGRRVQSMHGLIAIDGLNPAKALPPKASDSSHGTPISVGSNKFQNRTEVGLFYGSY